MALDTDSWCEVQREGEERGYRTGQGTSLSVFESLVQNSKLPCCTRMTLPRRCAVIRKAGCSRKRRMKNAVSPGSTLSQTRAYRACTRRRSKKSSSRVRKVG